MNEGPPLHVQFQVVWLVRRVMINQCSISCGSAPFQGMLTRGRSSIIHSFPCRCERACVAFLGTPSSINISRKAKQGTERDQAPAESAAKDYEAERVGVQCNSADNDRVAPCAEFDTKSNTGG